MPCQILFDSSGGIDKEGERELGGNEETPRPNLVSENLDIRFRRRQKTKAKYGTKGRTRSRKGLTRAGRSSLKEKQKATSQKKKNTRNRRGTEATKPG